MTKLEYLQWMRAELERMEFVAELIDMNIDIAIRDAKERVSEAIDCLLIG